MSTLFYVLVTLGGLLAFGGVVAWLTIYGGTLPSEVRAGLVGTILSGVAYMFIKVNSGGGGRGRRGGGGGTDGGGGGCGGGGD